MKAVQRFFLIIIIIFLVAFPKGGIKIGPVPLTWGYMLLMIMVPASVVYSLIKGSVYITKKGKLVMLLCLPFIIYSSFIISLVPNDSPGFLISYILSILIMPFLFLVFFNRIIDSKVFTETFSNVFIYCIRFIVVYGLVIFIQRILTGDNLEIPYLTVNIDDLGKIDEKYNLRGIFMKYTSTYNNGNIYGACMILFTPLYLQLEKRNAMKTMFLCAIILTLSRTAWIGLIIYMLLYFKKSITTVKAWTILITIVTVLIVALPILLTLVNLDTDFLTDSNLGGRADSLKVFSNFTLFGAGHFHAIGEIVYASIYDNFGSVGLILFFLYITSPLMVYYIFNKNSDKNSTTHWGLIMYIIICASDGAMLYIPTMAFFWFIASYILKTDK
jgi:hypothetical protein